MPTLVLDDVPVWLYDRIQRLAEKHRRTPAEIVIEILEAAFHTLDLTLCDESFDIPWPEGEPVNAD
jgi:predicted DNA-binding protein